VSAEPTFPDATNSGVAKKSGVLLRRDFENHWVWQVKTRSGEEAKQSCEGSVAGDRHLRHSQLRIERSLPKASRNFLTSLLRGLTKERPNRFADTCERLERKKGESKRDIECPLIVHGGA